MINNDLHHFAQQQTKQTLKKLSSHSNFKKIQQTILDIMQHTDNIPYCEEHNSVMYHFFQDDSYPKGVYRCCDSAYYRAGIPNWEILLSIVDFDTILQDDVYLESYTHLTTEPKKILLHLSSQGSDNIYIIEYDLIQKCIVTAGFNFPLSKSQATWRTKNSLWLCPAWQKNQCTTSGYSNEVWLLKRNQTFAQATLVFKAQADDFCVAAWRYLDTHGAPLDIIKQYHDFYHYSYYIINRNLSLTKLKLPDNCELCGYLRGYLIIHLKAAWQRAKDTFKSGSVIAVNLSRGMLKKTITLFEPLPLQSIEAIETSKDFIFIHYLDKVHSQAKVFKIQEETFIDVAFPKLNGINFELIDQPWGTNLFYIVSHDLIHAPILYLWDAQLNELSILRKQIPLFDSRAIDLKQYFAQSKDGTQIPYFWCGKQSQPTTPTLIYCYGGFAVNELPHYIPNIGKLWLEKGGAFVIANIRGGAELGEYWHLSAIKQNKHKTIEDLIAVIDDLQQNNRTSKDYTVIQGASNGGLIVANAFIQAKDKIKAVIAEAPLIDMLNYTKFGAGNSWIAEYGDPDDKTMYSSLKNLTPLHWLEENTTYPQILLTCKLNDDRVDPIHALLFHEKLIAAKQSSSLICELQGGHNSLNKQYEAATELACMMIFLYNAVGFAS